MFAKCIIAKFIGDFTKRMKDLSAYVTPDSPQVLQLETPMPARKPKPDEKPQFERFIETAREIGVVETGEALERVIRKIAPGRPCPIKPNPPSKP